MLVTSYILSFIAIFIFCMNYYYIFVMGTVSFYEFAYLLSHNMGVGGSVTVVLDTITNKKAPPISVSGKKTWVGDEDALDNRPA